MRQKFLWLVAALTLATMNVQATDYYVSPDGSGSNYTLNSPGKLNSTVLNKLKGGDVLYLLDGQYNFSQQVSINKSGADGNMYTICPYGDAKPILDFRNQANGSGNNGVVVKGNYVHIKGVTVRYAGYKGIWLEEAKYCILENIDVYGCCNAGVQLRSGGHNMVINCDSHENFDYQDNGGNADGFADKQGNACPGNIYIGCRAWGNSDDGWDSFQRVTSGTPTVYINCIAYNNGPATFDLSQHPRATGKDKDLACFSGKDLSNFANGGNPNGFKVGGKGTQHDCELYRCLAVGHRSKGFDQNNNAGKMMVINCTACDNKYNYGFGNQYAYTLDIYNNVALKHRSGGKDWDRYDGATVHQGNNTWNTGFSTSEADFEGLDIENIIYAERNADGTLAETTQFHLKGTATNLINTGKKYADLTFSGECINDYLTYNGTAPDLGCYEYGGASGIEALSFDAGQPVANMPRYNLRGQRVDDSYRGVVIQAGRKFLVK
jgi:hypothetical protein